MGDEGTWSLLWRGRSSDLAMEPRVSTKMLGPKLFMSLMQPPVLSRSPAAMRAQRGGPPCFRDGGEAPWVLVHPQVSQVTLRRGNLSASRIGSQHQIYFKEKNIPLLE